MKQICTTQNKAWINLAAFNLFYTRLMIKAIHIRASATILLPTATAPLVKLGTYKTGFISIMKCKQVNSSWLLRQILEKCFSTHKWMISCVDKSSWRTLYLFGLIRRCLCLTWSTWSTAVWTLDDMDGHLFQAVTLNKMNSIQKLWTNKKLADLWCLQAWLAFVSSSKKLEWNSLEVYRVS